MKNGSSPVHKLVSFKLTRFFETSSGGLNSYSAVMESLLSFSGTATELASEIKKACGKVIHPNILIKKIIRNQAELAEHGITFEMKRTHDRKEISLCYERVDCVGNDGKTDTVSVSNLSTQPSHPTQEVEK